MKRRAGARRSDCFSRHKKATALQQVEARVGPARSSQVSGVTIPDRPQETFSALLARSLALFARPEVKDTALLGHGENLLDNGLMFRRRCVLFQTLHIVERKHKAINESLVVRFRAIVLAP